MGNIRILSSDQTKEILSMDKVIKAVTQVYSEKAKGDTEVFPLVFHEFNPGVADMDIKSGWIKGTNIFGLKLVSWYGENPSKGLPALAGTVVVCDGETGFPVGILDGAYVTGIRTGASGALGAKYLARENSENLLIVGAGHISTFQIAATLILCPNIKKVRIYDGLSFETAEKLAKDMRDILKSEFDIVPSDDIVFEATSDIKEATGDSDIIITVTPARSPIIMADWVKPGTHFSCVGSDMSGKQEIDGNILTNARVFVDDLEQNCNVGEIEIPIKEGLIAKEDIVGELGHVINNAVVRRENDQQITVYDATGTALLDLITGNLALEIGEKENIGTVVSL